MHLHVYISSSSEYVHCCKHVFQTLFLILLSYCVFEDFLITVSSFFIRVSGVMTNWEWTVRNPSCFVDMQYSILWKILCRHPSCHVLFYVTTKTNGKDLKFFLPTLAQGFRSRMISAMFKKEKKGLLLLCNCWQNTRAKQNIQVFPIYYHLYKDFTDLFFLFAVQWVANQLNCEEFWTKKCDFSGRFGGLMETGNLQCRWAILPVLFLFMCIKCNCF